MLEASGQKPPCQDRQDHSDVVREYAGFLLSVPLSGHIEITWNQVER